MVQKKFAKFAAIVAVAATAAFPVFADAIDDTIKARQGFFSLVGFNFGQVVAMVKGKADYDAEAATKAATNLQALTKMHIAPLFPPGSDNVAKKGSTRALPAIWSEFDKIAVIIGKWQTSVDTLVAEAGNGKGALGKAIGGVGENCGACHKAYRAKNF